MVKAAIAREDPADLRRAKDVVFELMRMTSPYVGLEWTVAVHRSGIGEPRFWWTSNEGRGFVPGGVFMVNGVSSVFDDSFTDRAVSSRWVGVSDGPLVAAEHFAGRREMFGAGYQLLAVASSDIRVSALRGRFPKVPIGHCDRDQDPRPLEVPKSEDQFHTHRLGLVNSTLAKRLRDGDDVFRLEVALGYLRELDVAGMPDSVVVAREQLLQGLVPDWDQVQMGMFGAVLDAQMARHDLGVDQFVQDAYLAAYRSARAAEMVYAFREDPAGRVGDIAYLAFATGTVGAPVSPVGSPAAGGLSGAVR